MNIDLNESSQFYEHEAAKAGSLSLIILSEQEASYICFCKYLVSKFVGTKTLKKPSWEIVKAKLTSKNALTSSTRHFSEYAFQTVLDRFLFFL